MKEIQLEKIGEWEHLFLCQCDVLTLLNLDLEFVVSLSCFAVYRKMTFGGSIVDRQAENGLQLDKM